MNHYIIMGNDALYRFPSQQTFLAFIQARIDGKNEGPNINGNVYPAHPPSYGAKFLGRAWGPAWEHSVRDWQDLQDIIVASTPTHTPLGSEDDKKRDQQSQDLLAKVEELRYLIMRHNLDDALMGAHYRGEIQTAFQAIETDLKNLKPLIEIKDA